MTSPAKLSGAASHHGTQAARGRRTLRAGASPLLKPHPQRNRATVAAAAATPSSSRSRVVITGGNAGIGYETALALLRLDPARYEVVLACRDERRATTARAALMTAVPGAVVDTVPLELADLASVCACAARLLERSPPAVLINNAGVMACPKAITADGFEYQLGVNHLSHFLLTSLLLPAMLECGAPARIVNVSSAAHMFGSIDFDDLMRSRHYDPWEAYGQSKLAQIMFTFELARRLEGSAVTVNALNPGVVKTELGRYMPPWFRLVKLLAKTPEQGARGSVHLASSPEVQGVTGKFFVDCKPRSASKAAYDEGVARRLFEVSAELTKAPPVPDWRAAAVGSATAATAQRSIVLP